MDYWKEHYKLLQSRANKEMQSARAPLIDKLEKCHQEKVDLLEALDEIRSLDPGNIDMAYEIADEAIRKAKSDG